MFSQACVKNSVHGMGKGRHPLASACWDTHPPLPSACWNASPHRRSLQQVVRILLECILVKNMFRWLLCTILLSVAVPGFPQGVCADPS